MSRKTWSCILGTACLGWALTAISAVAADGPNTPSAVQVTANTYAPVRLQQANRYHMSDRRRVFHWNGPWGPGCYYAPGVLRFHSHTSRTLRPE